jgi:hypothetical protein
VVEEEEPLVMLENQEQILVVEVELNLLEVLGDNQVLQEQD